LVQFYTGNKKAFFVAKIFEKQQHRFHLPAACNHDKNFIMNCTIFLKTAASLMVFHQGTKEWVPNSTYFLHLCAPCFAAGSAKSSPPSRDCAEQWSGWRYCFFYILPAWNNIKSIFYCNKQGLLKTCKKE